MKTLGDRVRQRRTDLGYTQDKLALLVGVSQGLIGQIENDRNKGTQHIGKLARALKCSAYWLETGKADATGQHPVSISDAAVIDSTETITPLTRRVPIIGFTEAGNWRQIVDSGKVRDNYETVYIDEIQVNKYTYAIRFDSDSMYDQGNEKSVPRGAIVVIEPEEEARNGDCVVARFGDGTVTFRQLVVESGQSYLKPINPRYPIREMPTDTEILGVAMYSMAKNSLR